MDENRKIATILGGAAVAAIILRLILGPTLVAGPAIIYAVAKPTPAAELAVSDGNTALFPNSSGRALPAGRVMLANGP